MRSILAAIAVAATASAASAATSTFNTDAEGFTLSGGALTHRTGDGNPGGYILADDGVGSIMTLTLPGKFTAMPLLEGGAISFDARDFASNSSTALREFGEITLTATTGSITRDFFSGQLSTTAWTTIVAPLTAGDWGTDALSFASILANITGIQIAVESVNGLTEEVGIDNVSVSMTTTPIPLPAAAPMLIAGLAALGFARRRRG